jgi:riboflavin synthase
MTRCWSWSLEVFTGLVSEIGVITAVTPRDGAMELGIHASWHDLEPGESVAVRGACLTVVDARLGEFTVQVVSTTLERTCFGSSQVGDRVNLERALRVGERMGGHWVQGHVDGVGTVVALTPGQGVHLIDLLVPTEVAAVSIPLGSITVDGVSLTVNALPAPDTVQLAIVPYTLQHSTLGDLRVADRVHLEGDLVGKHVRVAAGRWQGSQEAS